MIRLRPYKKSDSEYIIKWFQDEITFNQWCAGKFTYPLTKEQLDEYFNNYEREDTGWIMTAIDVEGIPVGHFLMRSADYKNESIHLGFIVVDSNIRGKGYGKEMVSQAVNYSFEILKVKRVTLCVFDNNIKAHKCYKAVGFVDENFKEDVFTYNNDKWSLFEMAIKNYK